MIDTDQALHRALSINEPDSILSRLISFIDAVEGEQQALQANPEFVATVAHSLLKDRGSTDLRASTERQVREYTRKVYEDMVSRACLHSLEALTSSNESKLVQQRVRLYESVVRTFQLFR